MPITLNDAQISALREIVSILGVPQKTIAERANVNASWLSMLLKDEQKPERSVRNAADVKRVLGVVESIAKQSDNLATKLTKYSSKISVLDFITELGLVIPPDAEPPTNAVRDTYCYKPFSLGLFGRAEMRDAVSNTIRRTLYASGIRPAKIDLTPDRINRELKTSQKRTALAYCAYFLNELDRQWLVEPSEKPPTTQGDWPIPSRSESLKELPTHAELASLICRIDTYDPRLLQVDHIAPEEDTTKKGAKTPLDEFRLLLCKAIVCIVDAGKSANPQFRVNIIISDRSFTQFTRNAYESSTLCHRMGHAEDFGDDLQEPSGAPG